ncbi:pirin family protein [Acanthopleuribacter pedis]|uniref:Pirin family protein n=1 Tax=Acanthopleuribacter pedis TaxID=442870 RepID=A0A8J7U3T0_9BACT|nr:pirin family protein [Acanthopleuribacter pedis]MBO1317586.1 pirin family protein [Acanthopleuribacter pedis]
MTDLHGVQRDALPCSANCSETPKIESYPAKEAELGGGLKIRRALPLRQKRMIGAWCFLDHFGPLDFEGKAMDVAPHPHIGLQTVTWLLEGEIHHKDSLGYNQVIGPGAVNLMTAGKGITHSEETPPENSGRVHGVQFWIALPESERRREPDFQHVAEAPKVTVGNLVVQVFLGEALGQKAEPKVYTPMAGLDVTAKADGEHRLDLDPTWEYGLVLVNGEIQAEEQTLTGGHLHYLGQNRADFAFQAARGSHFVLVGGVPFGEEILMWWNFVARTGEELHKARSDWENEVHFGPVTDYAGGRLTAPPLNVNLK